MPKIKLPDLSDVDDVADFKSVPKGLYIMRIKEFNVSETGPSSNNPGQPMGVIIMEPVREVGGKKIKSGEYSNLWHRIPLDDSNPGWTPRLKEFITALGLKVKGGSLDPDKIVGELVQVKVRDGKDQSGERRADLDRMMPADANEPDDDDDDDDDDEEGEDELWTEEELEELDNDDLKEAAKELDVEVPKRLTEKGKGKLIAAILEAQEEDEDDDDDDDDEDDEEGYSAEDLEGMTAKELKEVLEENDVKVPAKVAKLKGSKLKAGLLEIALELIEEEEEDEDDDDDEEDDGYDDMSKTELVKEARSRKIKVKKGVTQEELIELLREDDEEDEDDDDDDDDDDEDDDDLDPDEMDKAELKAALEERGLKSVGNEKVLRARLTKALEDDDDGDPF